jgi:hypothetical protein
VLPVTLSRITDAVAAHYSSIDQRSAAQAVELVRALRDQLYEMTRRLAWLERQGVTGTNGRASAIRCEAAALRLDINEAQILIDRLQRRYLNSDGHAQTRRLYDTKLAEPSRAQNGTGNQIAL